MELLRKLKNSTLIKDSCGWGFKIFALIGTVFTIIGFPCASSWNKYHWISKLIVLIISFLIISFVAYLWKCHRLNKGVSIHICGIKVNIRQGDIFKEEGWKVISFNEFFDTTVDDVIIAKNSLNGFFIDNHVNDLSDLEKTIADASDPYPKLESGDRKIYPLGRIIPYKDFMLLAFTHFENNQARLSQKDYEDCLRVMWTEICRTYQNRPIFIPLLGSGITRFNGTHSKSESDLLKCMLCTLRTSLVNIKQPITILLTKESLQNINLYEFKKEK